MTYRGLTTRKPRSDSVLVLVLRRQPARTLVDWAHEPEDVEGESPDSILLPSGIWVSSRLRCSLARTSASPPAQNFARSMSGPESCWVVASAERTKRLAFCFPCVFRVVRTISRNMWSPNRSKTPQRTSSVKSGRGPRGSGRLEQEGKPNQGFAADAQRARAAENRRWAA